MLKKKPNIVIIGASGQIGSLLCDNYLEKDYDVIGVVRRKSVDNHENLKEALYHPNFTLAEGDVTDHGSVYEIVQKYQPTLLANPAGQSHVGTSFSQPHLTMQVNTVGVLNCLEGIRQFSPATRFLQYSTSEMFGNNYSTVNGHKIQNESTPFAPRSPYGISKVAAFHFVKHYREAYGLFASNIIMFNAEGERRGDKFVTRKISKYVAEFNTYLKSFSPLEKNFKQNLLDKIPKLKLGNLNAMRDWGYALEYVEAATLILDNEVASDFVICTGETHSIKEFLDVAFAQIGIKNWGDYVEIDPAFYRPSEVDFLRGSYDKAECILGWKPKIKFHELVNRMIAHDLAQQ